MDEPRTPVGISMNEIADYLKGNAAAIGGFALIVLPKEGTPGLTNITTSEPESAEPVPYLMFFAHKDASNGADIFERFVNAHIEGMPEVMAEVTRRTQRRLTERRLLDPTGQPFGRGN